MKPIRKLIVLLSLISILAVTAFPAAAQTNTPAPNPDLEAACALDVIFILDESYSLASPSTTPMNEVRASMQAIMGVLDGTGSFVQVVEFNIDSRNAIINGSSGWQEVDSDYVNTYFPYYINNTIGGASASGYNPVTGGGDGATTGTNWESALLRTAAIGDRVVGRTPLVIIMTDGVPNYIMNASNLPESATTANAVNEAIAAANTIKGQGRHIFGGGFGDINNSVANVNNLIAITGPENYDDTGNFLTADYLVVESSTELADAINQALAGLCAPSVSIKKLVDEGQGYVEASGWDFEATVEVTEIGEDADAYDWTVPVTGPASTEGTTQSDTTDVDGNAQFSWTPGSAATPETWTTAVTFDEVSQAGYQFVEGTCVLRDDDDQTENVIIEVTQLPFGPYELESNEYLSCEIKNAQSTFELSKTANPTQVTAPGGPVDFTVFIENTSDVPVTIDSLTDDVFGDITQVQGDITATDCGPLDIVIAVEDDYSCTFTANVTGNPGDTHTDTVTACEGQLCEEDDADVDIVGTPSIEVTKTANPTSVIAPGGPVVFTVHIENTGDVPLTIDFLDDDVFNDITTTGHDGITATTCDVTPPIALNVDGAYNCQFTATVTGGAGDTHTNIVTACDTSFEDDVCDEDDADVDIIGAAPAMEVTKTANPTQVTAPGGPVVFTVHIENTGNVPLTIDYLDDDVFNDITTTGHDGITATTCDVTPPIALNVDGAYNCQFTATVTGDAGTTHTNTVEACDRDGYDIPICDDDDADVDIVGGGGFCPAEHEDVGLSMTGILGLGQGSTTKGFRTRKIVIPNYQNLESLYGQLAAVDVGIMKYVRFLPQGYPKIQIHAPTSLAYRPSAVDWWGTDLPTDAQWVKGQFFWGKQGNKAPRAFVLWPTYETTEEYANVFTVFDESHENHVYWQLGWYAEQIQTIDIPTTQAAGADIIVNVALVDNNLDGRPVVLTVSAGGVEVVVADISPTNGQTLNKYTLTLENVPAGTSSIELKLVSPGPNESGPGWSTDGLGGDSVAMIGMSASYLCENETSR